MKIKNDELLTFIKDLLQTDDPIDMESKLFSDGALDSTAMVNLIVYVEGVSGAEIRPDQVTLENFDTPNRIVNFIEGNA